MQKCVIAAVITLAGCADPSGPATHLHPQDVLIAGTEEGAVVVDLDWRGIIRRSGPRFVVQGPNALNGRGELITAGRLADGATVMAGLDVETGIELWRAAIRPALRSLNGPLAIRSTRCWSPLPSSPDRRRSVEPSATRGTTLIVPPCDPRPNRMFWGPRNTSTRSTSSDWMKPTSPDRG